MVRMPHDKRRTGYHTLHSLLLHPLVHLPDSDDQKRWIQFDARDAKFQIRVRPDGAYVVRIVAPLPPNHSPSEWRHWTPDLEDFTSRAQLMAPERLPS